MALQEQEGAPIIDHFMSGLFDDAGRVSFIFLTHTHPSPRTNLRADALSVMLENTYYWS